MKKYLLKLIDKDISKIKESIKYWHKMLDTHKNTEYQTNRFKALNNNLKKAERYRERIVQEL